MEKEPKEPLCPHCTAQRLKKEGNEYWCPRCGYRHPVYDY